MGKIGTLTGSVLSLHSPLTPGHNLTLIGKGVGVVVVFHIAIF